MNKKFFNKNPRKARFGFIQRRMENIFGSGFSGVAFVYDLSGALMYFLIGVFGTLVITTGKFWISGFMLVILLYIIRTVIFSKKLVSQRYF